MRAMERVKLDPRVVPMSAHRLRQLVRATLLYTVDQTDAIKPLDAALPHLRQLAELDEALERDFFWEIWVNREPFDELCDQLGSPGYRVLHGARGSGKSTMLSALWLRAIDMLSIDWRQANYEDLSGFSAHYINLRLHGSAVRRAEDDVEASDANEPPPHRRVPHRVCGIVYQQIFEWLFPIQYRVDDSLDPSGRFNATINEWEMFCFEKSSHYDAIRDQILSHRRKLNRPLEVVLDPATLPSELASGLAQANSSFARDEDDKLTTLLSFLTKKQHVPIVLIDNVDRYGHRLSQELDRKLLELCSAHLSLCAILGIRSSVFARLPTEASDSTRQEFPLGVVSGLPPFSQEVDEEEPSDDDDLDEAKDAELRDELLLQIVEKRLDYLGSFLNAPERKTYVKTHIEPELRTVTVNTLEDFFTLCLDLSRSRLRSFDALDAKWILLRWHNYSLRSSLAHLIDILTVTISGRDALFPLPDRNSEAAEIGDADVHELRSLLWRHLVFAEQPVRPSSDICIDLFETREMRSSSFSLSFPKLRILQLIAVHRSLTWRTLLARASEIGLSDDVSLANVLSSLAATRGYESEGLIRVDVAPNKLNARMPPDTVIKLRPAGEFVIRRLFASCEYLFWSAMRVDDLSVRKKLGISVALSEPQVLDDGLRAMVAAKFVRVVVIDGLMRDSREPGWGDAERAYFVASLDRVLPNSRQIGGGFNVASRLYSSLFAFTSKIESYSREASSFRVKAEIKALKESLDAFEGQLAEQRG